MPPFTISESGVSSARKELLQTHARQSDLASFDIGVVFSTTTSRSLASASEDQPMRRRSPELERLNRN